MKRKFIAIILMAAMVLSMTACGKSSSTDSSQDAPVVIIVSS
ncbi:MAG: hypothetical protein WCD89_06340 [Anaerocolumna sp.]